MKNILFPLLLISFGSFAQNNSSIELIKDKPKTKVDRIEDGPKTYIPRIDDAKNDGLLPLRNKKYSADELLDIKSNEPNQDDLLDISFPEAKPTTPNSGQEIFESRELESTFSFNKKISFKSTTPEGNMVSYFYLNTKDGSSLMDWPAMKTAIHEEVDGEVNNIMTANKDFYNYIKSSEGNYSMKMSSGNSMVLHDLQTGMLSEEFFKSFKKTGKVQGKGTGNSIPRVEYAGVLDGEAVKVWLSDARGISVDMDYTYSLTGFFGLGYLVSPTGRTYMITGLETAEGSIMMVSIENVNKTFEGKNFQPMGNMMAEAISQNMPEINESLNEMYAEAEKEEDPELRSIMLKQAAEAEKMLRKMESGVQGFTGSSDLNDLQSINLSSDDNFMANYYDMSIISLDKGIKENQLEIQEIARNGGNPTKTAELKCMISCAQVEKVRMEKLKVEHLAIMDKYKNDHEKRDELISQLMQRAAKEVSPCDC